jgi:hypothetical protein
MLGSWTTDAIGIHSVFGGFILGVAMPRGFYTEELRRQLEPVAVVFLLPIFFTFSGLNIGFESRAHPDEVNAEVMKDPRLAKMDCNEMPFDCKRMAYGGFEVFVDAIAPVPDRVKRSQS